MIKQFFGKPFFVTLIALAIVFGIAVLSFGSHYTLPLLAIATIVTFSLGIWKLEYGIYGVFAELFANSHGHLIASNVNGFNISLRMAAFVGLMCAWLVLFITRNAKISLKDERLTPFIVLGIAVVAGFTLGFLNDPAKAFSDGNAYIYLGLVLPILSVKWDAMRRRVLLQVFTASVVWVILLTLGLLFTFTHVPEFMLGDVYKFIRDTRTGELTKMSAGIFRIFLQAQFSIVIFTFLIAPILWLKNSKRNWWVSVIALAFSEAAVLISLSRSFWVGIFAGSIALLFLVYKFVTRETSKYFYGLGSLALSKIFGMVILVIVVLLPIGYTSASIGSLSGLFSSRATEVSDQAIDSRWKLLTPMVEHIHDNPILGYGFGKEIEFITDDPRIRAENPDGLWKTFSFEWGWLELWIKMGLVGPLAFIYLFYVLLRGLLPHLHTKHVWLGIGLICSLVMLYATHVFSPYLNHPLGLGLIMFMVPFLDFSPKTKKKGLKILALLTRREPQSQTLPVLPMTER